MVATSPQSEVRSEQLIVDGVRVHVRRTEGDGVPTVFVHGNPTASWDWLPFMERLAGPALAPDLPGWGQSEAPGHLDYSMHGLAGFFERIVDAAGLDTYKLVCHDWGAIGLIAAQAAPERVERLVLCNIVPLVPGYRWHWVARWFWRRRGLGELINATSTKAGLRLVSREASPKPGPMPREFIDAAWDERRPGAWPQMLELYRSADPEALAAAGSRLAGFQCPALVIWGADDPYLPLELARAHAERLPHAELVEVPEAGHWPWIDQPRVVDEVVAFLDA